MTNAQDRVTSGVSRRQFMTTIGLTGVGVVAGGALGYAPYRAVAAEPAAKISPFDLHFSIVEKYRPFALIGPNFVQYDAETPARLTTLAPKPPGNAGSVSGDGGVRIGDDAEFYAVLQTTSAPRAPYGCVTVDVRSLSGDTARDGVVAGLVQDAANSVLVAYDAPSQRATIEVTRDGTTTVAGAADATLVAPFHFAFVVNENYVVALADTGSGWVPLVRRRVTDLIDLRDPATLARHRYGYGARAGSGAVTISRARAGYFGRAGVRDPHVVTYADGTPYIRDGKVYLTLTQAGLAFFQAAHWGVFTLDLHDPTRLEQVAVLFSERDGVVLGDHAGHIVVQDNGEFVVAMSGWGNFSFQGNDVYYARTRENLLSGVHVVPTRRLPLPTDVAAWDPALHRIDGQWHVAFTESPSQGSPWIHYPAMAVGPPGGDVDQDLTLVGRDDALVQSEGSIVQKVGGTWYHLASDGRARRYRVYDLDMNRLGYLNAPYGTNIPHPMVFPVPERGRTRYLMVTFDGTQYQGDRLGYGTHGDFIVMSAPETRPGYEFSPVRPT